MIPQEKSAAVSKGLREAFGTTVIEEIRSVTGGLSSDLVFRIVVQGSPFLLKIVTRISEMNHPRRVFACMKAAAEAGVAPRVWYANAEDGISIIDFVEAAPFPEAQALLQLPRTLRRLHAVPPFPKTFNYVTAHNGFIWRFRAASLLYGGEIEEVFTRYEDFHRRIWAGEVDLADNDLKIVYGLVHWEQLVRNTRQTRFDEALGIVSERNTSREGVRLLLPSAS